MGKTIKDMALVATKKLHEDPIGSYPRGYEDGANAVLDIISDVLDEYSRETAYYDVKGAIRELKREK